MKNMISGHIRDFDVFLSNDVVTVINEDVVITKQRAPGISEFAAKAKAFRIGWAMLPGGDDVIYLSFFASTTPSTRPPSQSA